MRLTNAFADQKTSELGHHARRFRDNVTIADGDSIPVAVRLIEVGVPFVFHTGDPSYLQSKKDWPNAPILNKPVSPFDLVSALVQVSPRRPDGF